jgi:hypothetical protein
VIRQLSLDEQAGIKKWALKYVENARMFREHYERLASETAREFPGASA